MSGFQITTADQIKADDLIYYEIAGRRNRTRVAAVHPPVALSSTIRIVTTDGSEVWFAPDSRLNVYVE